MYYFTSDTIAQANEHISTLDAKVGGVFCILHCLSENIEENISYTINGERLRSQLSAVFDKKQKRSFENVKSSYIIFARDWAESFFKRYIKNKVDLLACSVFFLRRHGFESEYTEEEVIDTFIKCFNLQQYKEHWFFDGHNITLAYNQGDVEDNQTEFYSKMNYVKEFKSILFSGVIQKSAADLKAAGQIQTLYSGSGVQSCFLLSDESLEQYYIMSNSEINDDSENDSEDYKQVDIEGLLSLYNQQFAFACIDLMKERKLLTANNLQILADKDKCASMFKHNNYHGILFELDSDTDENEQKNGQDGRPRYYAENYDIDGAEYAVSSQWRPVTDNDDSRTPFVNWIIEQLQKVKYETGYKNDFARNRILFGAPGTGKSYTINKEREELLGKDNELDYERVTFHPDYSYANFVGTYKPVPCKDSDGKDAITYEYVPGPFMRVFVRALKNGRTNNIKPYLLIIEEINRANVAAVFGDVFQLLDRDKNEVSEYSIQASEDIKKFLAKPENLGGNPEDYQKIRIPDNMFIWATMNSADQGVFPMDTAFKRRWDFKYLGIDESDAEVQGKAVVLGTKVSHRVEWNKLRKAINKFLATQKINEDKQLGPYFIAKRIVVPENGNEIDSKKFIETFKNKVIMYLFEDAAKQKRATLFEGCFQNSSRYSEICKEFEEKGIGIFNSEIQMATEPEDLPNTEATNESATEDTNE